MSDYDGNEVALVTGANKGIGLEIARQLAQRGYTVLIGARDAQRGTFAAQQLLSEGLRAVFLPLDVTSEASIDAAATSVWLATLPPDGPTGGFFDENGTIPW